MPIINGFKLVKKLKEIDDSVKVCFITTFEEYYQSLIEQFDLNEKCFIKKPQSKYDLIKLIADKLTTSK
jgi:two-component SAPR family response regulator